jgi:hypothetical protein
VERVPVAYHWEVQFACKILWQNILEQLEKMMVNLHHIRNWSDEKVCDHEIHMDMAFLDT